jgi:hypothetical protein
MVDIAGEDRGWQAANDDGNRWLMNADPKGPTTSQTSKWADNGPRLTMSQTSNGVDNRLGLTMSQN